MPCRGERKGIYRNLLLSLETRHKQPEENVDVENCEYRIESKHYPTGNKPTLLLFDDIPSPRLSAEFLFSSMRLCLSYH
jgi:hypothetical protein